MINVFDYLDYCAYLKDDFEFRKNENSRFSYRYLGKRLSLDPGFLVKVHQGKSHITLNSIPRILEFCGLEGKAAKYFEMLVRYRRATSLDDVSVYYEKMMSLKGVESITLEGFQYAFYKNWYHSAIRSLLGIYKFSSNYEALAKKLSPKIKKEEAKFSIELLLKLGLIKKNPSGVFELTDTFVTTGSQWKSEVVKHFQKETIELAKDSLDHHPKDKRDISTVTVAIAQADLMEMKICAEEFRKKIFQIASKSPHPDSVYQVNLQMIPLTDQVSGV